MYPKYLLAELVYPNLILREKLDSTTLTVWGSLTSARLASQTKIAPQNAYLVKRIKSY